MSEANYHQLLQDSLREIRRLRAERDELLKRDCTKENVPPIAIVGMACRFPNANSPDALYASAQDRRDCIQTVPKERWDVEQYYDADHDAKGKMATRAGGFLDDVRGFDAAFFGIAPREAKLMDPQQRMLLETTWTALEQAGIAPDSVHGKSVGVFVGLSNLEYPNVVRAADDAGLIDSHFGTGNSGSIAAGRIAYLLGVQGPAMIVDTACSSSLVALHLATNSLRNGECEMAIVGGVNLMLLPETFIHFSNARMLSPDGRCKPFSKEANGYGRGEGCGVVILKRLDEAIRDADSIDAVIRGSGVKHDGRSAGLTAPNGTSQELVIRAALQNAGLNESDIHFVEAHGTGTPLGDPIEAAALSRVYGKNRTTINPLWLTAIKANIGHTEAAAGMAGLIHAVECLKHRRLPPLLHHRLRSEHITSDTIEFPTEAIDLNRIVGPVRAGVSSFGFSGTNSHVILEEFTGRPGRAEQTQFADTKHSAQVLVLSAKSEQALSELAMRFRKWLGDNSKCELPLVSATLMYGRTHYAHRLGFEASSAAEALEKLDQFTGGITAKAVAGNSLVAKRYLDGEDLRLLFPMQLGQKRLRLPTYPFQHSEFWIEPASSNDIAPGSGAESIESYVEQVDIEIHEDLLLTMFGSPVLSTANWLQSILRLSQTSNTDAASFDSIEFLSLVPINRSGVEEVSFSIDASAKDRFHFRAFVGKGADIDGTPNFTGNCHLSSTSEWLGGALQEVEVLSLESIRVGELSARLANLGLDSSAFNASVEQVSVGANYCLVSMRPALHHLEITCDRSWAAAIDAALCVTDALFQHHSIEAVDATSFMPTAVRRFDWFDRQDSVRWTLVRLKPITAPNSIEVDVFAWSMSSNPVFQMLGVRFEGFSGALLNSTASNVGIAIRESEPASDQQRLTVDKLLALPRDQRSSSLENYLRRELAKEMELSETDIPLQQPLADLGLDSLMIFRLSIQLESELGVTLDSRTLLGGITLRGLTESLLLKLTFVEAEGKPG